MLSRRLQWNLAQNPLSTLLEAKREAREPIFDLTQSNPTRANLHLPLGQIAAALSHPGAANYDPQPLGLRSAREAICRYYAELGHPVDPDQVLLTASTSESYGYLFKLLTDPGDNVLIPAPSYPLFEFLANLELIQTHAYPLLQRDGRWQADWQFVADRIDDKTRAVVVVNPNNPTGNFINREGWETLDRICAEKGVAIIADEVFFDYRWHQSTSVASSLFCRNALTFTLNGFSKMLGQPQLKLGWIVLSGGEANPMRRQEAWKHLEVIADTYLSVGTPVQWAVPTLLELRTEIQSQIQYRCQKNWTKVRDWALPAEGGWNAILPLAGEHSEERTTLELLENTNVYAYPGFFFDLEGEHLVVSLLTDFVEFDEGLQRIQAHLKSRKSL